MYYEATYFERFPSVAHLLAGDEKSALDALFVDVHYDSAENSFAVFAAGIIAYGSANLRFAPSLVDMAVKAEEGLIFLNQLAY